MPGPAPTGSVEESAPAKINLALHVTGRRADGYHLLDSLVAFAAVGDRLRLSAGRTGFEVSGPFAAAVPLDDANLCLRAARLAGCRAETSPTTAAADGIAIALHKALPVAAGIGGGSADAAAVLRGLARLGRPVPPDTARLGADVPVCLTAPKPARMRGIGDAVTLLPALPAVPMVLCNPGVALPTPTVFAALETRDNPPMAEPPRFADAAGLTGWLAGQRNDLQPPAIATAPVIAEVLTALDATGAGLARMSGSGATCFGLYASPAAAEAAAERLSRRGWWALATAIA